MPHTESLSKREREVVELLLEGKSNKQIALALHVTERTVEFHLNNIYTKYQVGSRMELVLMLKDATAGADPAKLVDSTVAEQGNLAENSPVLNGWGWVPSLKAAVANFGKEDGMNTVLNSSASDENRSMSFFESIRVCLTKYADFTGRATRAEFWWFSLFMVLVAGGLLYVNEALSSLALIGLLLPFLAVGARRLRDSGYNPWWLAILLAPVGGIIALGILWAMPSSEIAEE